MTQNHALAKSISHGSWARFFGWVEHYAKLYGIVAVAVSLRWTSQNCSGCGRRVLKSLCVRTHSCPYYGLLVDRDHNAALKILQQSYRTAR